MAQLSDDCFATGDSLMPLATALETLRQRLAPVTGVEEVALDKAAGRILADDITTAIDVPPHDNSAVDGYAFRHADLKAAKGRLRVVGRAAAGHPFDGPVGAAEAVRIFTGGAMPAGPDTVLMQEDAVLIREEAGPEAAMLIVPDGLAEGANRRHRGEDVSAGSVILTAGRHLGAADIGLAASVGCPAVRVRRRLAVGLFSTGDELAEAGAPLAAGQIHDANRHMLAALIKAAGATVRDLGILPDEPARIEAALATAAGDCDMLITSGGVSVGDEDHVRPAVEKLGGLHFWRLAIKPGRPLALGQVAGVPFAGLPGNPVAAALTFIRLIRPMIGVLAGGRWQTPLFHPVIADFSHRKKAGRREWVRVSLSGQSGEMPLARKLARQGAGVLSSVTGADGVIEIDEDRTRLSSGDTVPFLSFAGFGL